MTPFRDRTLELLDDPTELDASPRARAPSRPARWPSETLADVYDRVGFVRRAAERTLAVASVPTIGVAIAVPEPYGASSRTTRALGDGRAADPHPRHPGAADRRRRRPTAARRRASAEASAAHARRSGCACGARHLPAGVPGRLRRRGRGHRRASCWRAGVRSGPLHRARIPLPPARHRRAPPAATTSWTAPSTSSRDFDCDSPWTGSRSTSTTAGRAGNPRGPSRSADR